MEANEAFVLFNLRRFLTSNACRINRLICILRDGHRALRFQLKFFRSDSVACVSVYECVDMCLYACNLFRWFYCILWTNQESRHYVLPFFAAQHPRYVTNIFVSRVVGRLHEPSTVNFFSFSVHIRCRKKIYCLISWQYLDADITAVRH